VSLADVEKSGTQKRGKPSQSCYILPGRVSRWHLEIREKETSAHRMALTVVSIAG